MTNEQLLIPRYQVCAEGYPDMPFRPMEVVILSGLAKDGRRYWKSSYDVEYYESFFDHYPSIFEKLRWWEGRHESMMPLYIIDGNGHTLKVGWTRNFLGDLRWKAVGGPSGRAAQAVPATSAQIADYLLKSK